MTLSLAAALLVATATSLAQPAAPTAATTLARPVDGRVVLECVVAPKGALADCKVVEETPVGHGLGQRAIEASGLLKMDAPVVDGVASAGARVRIPFVFEL